MWNQFDRFCNKLANLLIIAIILIVLWFMAGKPMMGKYMMYRDYYNKVEQSK